MNLRLGFLLLFFGTQFLSAQAYKLLKGKLVHPVLSVSQIHIVNASRGNAEISDVEGNFEISVRIGEKLQFSGIQFKPQELLITEAVFEAAEVSIYLETFVNELSEVVVKPHQLSGSLTQDMGQVKPPINFHNVGIPGFKGKRKERIVSGKSLILSTLLMPISGGLNIDAVYKHLSGYYKNLKKRRAVEANFEALYAIIRFYGLYYFEENFNLKPEMVYDFVLACSENTELISLFKKQRHDEVMVTFTQYYATYATQTD